MELETNEWAGAEEGWRSFCAAHPELGLNPAQWRFYNTLRGMKQQLLDADAIRKVMGKRWILHRERFDTVVFDLMTRGGK